MGDFFQPMHPILLFMVFSFFTLMLYVLPFWFIYKRQASRRGFARCVLFLSGR